MMNGLSLIRIIIDGLFMSIGASAILLGAMTINPRLMRSDYPSQVKETIPPLTSAENRQLVVVGLLFWGFALGVIIYSTRSVIASNDGNALFLPVFLNTYFVFEVFNLFDLLVLDYLIITKIKPKFLFVSGTETMEKYNTFSFHFAGFLKGLLIGVVISLVVTLVTVFLAR